MAPSLVLPSRCPFPAATMEEQLEQTTEHILQILTLTSCNNFLLHLPFTGFELKEFLCSCFHQRFVNSIKTRGYHEDAVYIEPRKRGRMFICFSLTGLSDDRLSKLRDGDSFHPVSVSDRDSLRQPKPLCYSLVPNMVLEQPCSYAEGRQMDHILGVQHALDALTAYLAIRYHCYGQFRQHPCVIMAVFSVNKEAWQIVTMSRSRTDRSHTFATPILGVEDCSLCSLRERQIGTDCSQASGRKQAPV